MAGQVSVQELLAQIDQACGRMSVKNPHRTLLKQCAFSLAYLETLVLQNQSQQERRTSGGIVLPPGVCA